MEILLPVRFHFRKLSNGRVLVMGTITKDFTENFEFNDSRICGELLIDFEKMEDKSEIYKGKSLEHVMALGDE